MIPRLRTATVLGAGTMGAQIACLLAGAGVQVRLLDLDAATASAGLERALKLRPSPSYRPQDVMRIRPGGFDDLPPAVRDADWILEAVVEQLAPKRALFARVDDALTDAGSSRWPIVSSNTSGISIAELAAGRSEAFGRAFLGTHFFNPPRYTRLLELIPLATTAPRIVASLEDFAARHLGKGTVIARDTPAFIANRLGVFGLQRALALAQELGLGVDEVDELTGPLIGRPRSATFRTLDVVGLDVAVAVADHCYADLPADPRREVFAVSPLLRGLVERGALGEKTGAGFFRRVDGEIQALDLATGEYRPRRRLASAAVEAARTEADLGARLRRLVAADDAAGRFLWCALTDGLVYAAEVANEIAHDLPSIDRAMRLGFGWQLGPFETWDALGVAPTVERLRAEGRAVPRLVAATLAGTGRFSPPEPPADEAPADRSPAAALPGNAAATLRELDDRILALELHGKLNIIGADTLAMVQRAVEVAGARYDGLVIGTQAADFSAGANLALMLVAAEEGDWDELERGIRAFQAATQAIRYAAVPVVLAPRGLTLGGGAEMALAAARRQPLAETYLGLVETGVGLIPAGGGTTATARRIAERAAGTQADRFAFFQAAVETIAFARVSTSAEEARALGYLAEGDLVSTSPERQWADAARVATTLAEVGYRPPVAAPIAVVGRRGVAAAEALTYNQLSGHQLSEHDRKVVLELTGVLSGGDVVEGAELAEAYLLELERAAFLRLLGEPLTRARIRHTLKTGKPLRN
ncbi:MAG TPA: 3-hydroxyacyl-CoA dehydrogenase/enoyl-CoA hydratase family protein [Candidatus Sulfotelmatobacter sp.]|nr:3-hydroxyacyl-CoA dehydrogenase/enoyl-CoA hydratase family protein [Candidatus Sulfotelmatobacter sp.]